MLAVVLDTNAVHSDPWLTSTPGVSLVQLANSSSCLIVFPEVVRDEIHRQRREAAQASHAQASKGVKAMAKAGVDVTDTATHLGKSFQRIDADIDEAFATLFRRGGVTTEPVPNVAVDDILARDLARRRPFMEVTVKQNPASVGFRDTLIWETVLAILDPSRGHEKVLLVTADKGFLTDDSRSIHPDLLADLVERGLGLDRLVSAKNVPHAVTIIETTATEAARITAATDALYELVGEEIDMQLVYGGDYDYPDFVKFTVPRLESANITYIDQTSEFELSNEGESVVATADATIYIEGGMFKGDWFSEEGDSVRIAGELNEHYLEASSEVEVRVVVEIDVSGDSPEAVRIVLEDRPDEARRTENSVVVSQ